jgi:hypothetical protein
MKVGARGTHAPLVAAAVVAGAAESEAASCLELSWREAALSQVP